MDYDRAYGETNGYFGEVPERILVEYSERIEKGGRVLDVGAGQGRNAAFLARKGFTVDAIDPSRRAVESLGLLASSEKIAIHAHHCGFDSWDREAASYSAVCIFGLMQILSWDSAGELKKRARLWTRPRGLIFVTSFTTDDPSFAEYSTRWRVVGKNSFADNSGRIRTYFEPGEAVKYFEGFDVLHHREGMGPEHRHGDGPLQRHGLVELVLRR